MKKLLLGLFISLFIAIPICSAVIISSPGGKGDMTKAVYDTDKDGVVDDSEDVTCTGCVDDTELASTFLTASDVDTESELETLLSDVSDVFTNNDGALDDDDLSDNASTELTDTANILYEAELDSETELESQLSDVSDVFTNNDGALTDDDLSDNASTELTDTANILYEAELDSESELESQLSDVSNVFTNNDGALNDDDVTLTDVQGACTNDFHNIGGTDDDVPDTGDLGIIDTEAEFESELFAIFTANDGALADDDISDNASTELTDTAEILYESELDSESELEAQLSDVTNVFTNNDGALNDDDVTAADVGTVSGDLDDTDASIEWENAADLESDGSLSTGVVGDNEIDYSAVTLDDFDYQTAWRVFYSNVDGDVTELALGADGTVLQSNGASAAPTFETPAGGGDMLKSVYDVGEDGTVDDAEDVTCVGCVADGELASTFLAESAIDTEVELESILSDVSDVFTNNDGALDDDDVTDDNVETMATAGGAGTAPLSDGALGLTMTDVLTEAELDTEAELEAQLSDVTNVFTNNDGALNDDDVTAVDVGLASGDLDDTDASIEWENAADLESDGSLSNDTVGPDQMADGDHGDVSWTSGAATVEDIQCTDCVTAADIADATTTDVKCIYIESPTADDDLQSIWTANGFAATITKIWCESDQADGPQLDLQVDDGTPADVDGTDLDCDNTPAEDESMGGDATLADGDRLDLVITSVGGSETWLSICWTYTVDD